MNINIVFKILSYILMPVAFLLGLFDVTAISGAISNPALLLPVFIIAAVVMYIFSSFRFYRNGINGDKTFSKKTKDFIKVNGFVALGFSALSLVQGVVVLTNKKAIVEMIENYNKMAQSYALSSVQASNFLYVSLAISIVFSLVLIAHIFICLKLMKQYENKFVD